MQRSEVQPTREANLVDANFSFICGVCGKGKVHIVGKFDWRQPVEGVCDNPQCGDPNNQDHGSTFLVDMHPDGTLDQYHRTGVEKRGVVNDTTLRHNDPYDGPLIADLIRAEETKKTELPVQHPPLPEPPTEEHSEETDAEDH